MALVFDGQSSERFARGWRYGFPLMTGGQTSGTVRPMAVVERDRATGLWFLGPDVLVALGATKEVDQRSGQATAN